MYVSELVAFFFYFPKKWSAESKKQENKLVWPYAEKIANYADNYITIKLYLKKFSLTVTLVLINRPGFVYEAERFMMK